MYRPEGLIKEKPTNTLGSKKLEKIIGSRKAVSSSESKDSTGSS